MVIGKLLRSDSILLSIILSFCLSLLLTIENRENNLLCWKNGRSILIGNIFVLKKILVLLLRYKLMKDEA
jgi:hypothetical protein